MITRAEHLVVEGDPRTYLFVRITSREAIDRVELFAESKGDRRAIPHEAIATKDPCLPDATCLGIVLGPGAADRVDTVVLEVPDIGHRASAPILRVPLDRTRVAAQAIDRNKKLEVVLDDPIRRRFPIAETLGDPDQPSRFVLLFSRRFDAHVAQGPCSASPPPADPAWRELGGPRTQLAAEYPAGADPLVCLSVRPALPAGGPVLLQTSVPPRALLTEFEHVYTPAVETAPLVFIPFFDLELPSADRCNEAEGLIQSAVMSAASEIASQEMGRAEILMIEPVRLARLAGVPCRQDPLRRFDPVEAAAKMHSAIDARFGSTRRVRALVVYSQNLDLAMPEGLQQDFQALGAAFEDALGLRRLSLLAIAPERAAGALATALVIPYVATEEPAFRETIVQRLRDLWPFRSTIHTDETVVPLTSRAERERFLYYRLCSSSVPVTPIGRTKDVVLEIDEDGPAYRVSLPSMWLLPPSEFAPPSVRVRWEGCEALCDHPAPGGSATEAWTLVGGCRPALE